MAKYELSSKKNVVLLGDKEFTFFTNIAKSYHQFYWDMAGRGFELGQYDNHPKVLHKVLHEAFGSKIPYRFGAAMYNTFIRDNFPVETHFAMRFTGKNWKLFSPSLVKRALTRIDLVQQAVKDNTLNLLPLMIRTGMNTQELKQRFGSGTWKKIAKTSKSRMMYLSQYLEVEDESVKGWVDIRTCMLRAASGLHHDVELIAAKIAPKAGTLRATEILIYDTMEMAKRLGETCNPNWSYRRWNEAHDEFTKNFYTKKYSSKPFTEVVSYEEGPYTFTLLNSQSEIAIEGSTMRHCVGSYAERAARGDYAVFKVEGKERATLGLYKHHSMVEGTGMMFDQCYGFGNSRCSDELIAAAYKILGRHNDYLRLRDGRVSGGGNQDPRSVLDHGRQGVPLDQRLRGNAIPAVWIDDLNWA